VKERLRVSRWAALAVAGLVVLAPAAAMAQDASGSPAPAASTATGAQPENPYAENGAVPGSGAGKRVGYISLGENVPFVKLVSDGIREQAGVAGLDLTVCDSKVLVEEALACGQLLGTQQVQGVINFQVFQDSSPEICAAYGSVPTIAIDIVQPPCETVFMGANNHEAGRLSGAAIGKYAKDTWDCDYTAYVSLESAASGQANTDRMGGFRDGFKEYCDIPADKERILDGADRTDPALEAVSNLLPALPGNRIVVVAINEDGILGALGAARTLGREADVFVAGQGADPSAWKDIACNPQYIATVAYFPERYGRTVVPAMIDILDGKTVTGPLFTAHEVIDRTNIREVYPDTPAC
jgi:ribose transport system substrate-binding protein